MIRFRCFVFSLLVLAGMISELRGASVSARRGASVSALPKDLKAKVERYCSTIAGYEQGDLLTKSQWEDLQAYLLRTEGSSLATHHKWRWRMLKDTAPLAKKFRAGGAPVLRQVAAKLGGYEELDHLSRRAAGRKQIQAAVEANSPDELLQSMLTERKKKTALPESKQRQRATLNKRIYTTADFIAVLRPRKSEGKSRDPEPKLESGNPTSLTSDLNGGAKG